LDDDRFSKELEKLCILSDAEKEMIRSLMEDD